MKKIRKFFERLATAGAKRYCSCGHTVSANLPFCPHCGCVLRDLPDHPID